MGDKKKKPVLPRELRLGDIIYLAGTDNVWIRQGDKDTHCLNYCCSQDEFFELARFVAQTHQFDIKEVEIPEAMIAYEFVPLEEKDVEADEVAAEEE